MWRYVIVAIFAGLLGFFIRGQWQSFGGGMHGGAGPGAISPILQRNAVNPGDGSEAGGEVGGEGKPSAGVIRDKTRSALAELDVFKKSRAWAEVLAMATPENIPWIRSTVFQCHDDGMETALEGDLLSVREGQFIGEAGMKPLPAEVNGRPDYIVLNRLKGWTMADPAAPGRWLDTLPAGRTRDMLRQKWMEGLKEAAPSELAKVFPQLNAEAQSQAVGRLMQGLLAEKGATGAEAWYLEFCNSANSEAKRSAYMALVDRVTQNKGALDASVKIIESAAQGDGELIRQGFDKLVWRSARFSPERTLDLLEHFSAKSPAVEQDQPGLLQKIFEWGSSSSINSFATWLNAHKSSPIYDRVASEFSVRSNADDPENARRWAESIKDAGLRVDTINRMTGGGGR